MPRGSKPGERRGGRKKGTPNRVTMFTRETFQKLIEGNVPHLQAMLDEVRYGIEIEKQMPDGQTVVGRLNADPKGALDVLIKLAEFCIPKLGRTEVTGENGGPVRHVFRIEEP